MTDKLCTKLKIGDLVAKTKGDYTYEGEIISVMKKKSGQVRYAVENEAGQIYIFNRSNIDLVCL